MSLEAKVRNIVIGVVHRIRPDSTALEAASQMVEKNVGCLVVAGREGAIGMITERDILGKVTAAHIDPGKVNVSHIM